MLFYFKFSVLFLAKLITAWVHTTQSGPTQLQQPFLSPGPCSVLSFCSLDTYGRYDIFTCLAFILELAVQACRWMFQMKTSNAGIIAQLGIEISYHDSGIDCCGVMGFLQDVLSCSHKNTTPVSQGERIETRSQSSTWWIWTSVGHSLFLVYYYIITLRLLVLRSFLCWGKRLRKTKWQTRDWFQKGLWCLSSSQFTAEAVSSCHPFKPPKDHISTISGRWMGLDGGFRGSWLQLAPITIPPQWSGATEMADKQCRWTKQQAVIDPFVREMDTN